jgi:hypothetical protein
MFCNPSPVSDALLQDLCFEDMAKHFPKSLIHATCEATQEPMFALSATDRALALMPITTTTGGKQMTAWAPFLIDCGSPGTFFTPKTIDALKLDTADHVAVMGKRVLWNQSGGHFDDLNLLGTNFLRGGDLLIRYPAAVVSFKLADVSPETWVTDGKMAFCVSPKHADVAALKLAIKEYCMYAMNPALLIVRDPSTGNVMADEDVLHAGMKYVFELP